VAVMTFGGSSKIVQSFTENLDEVEHSIRSAVLGRARGSTRILSAVRAAADYFRRQPRNRRRRAILLVTDNEGLPSGRAASVIRNLWEADASLSGLQIRTPREDNRLRYKSPLVWLAPQVVLLTMERMNTVIERTGGDFVNVTGPGGGAEFHELMRRLRLRYTLQYAMPQGKPGEERRIQVMLSGDAQAKNPQARVRARTGYRIPQKQRRG
jgi:hypothetical protein